jgi:mRNA interferase RelE/StbE
MAAYLIQVRTSVWKDCANMPREIVPRILEKIEALSETPVPHGARKLSGSESLYRIRVGEYRVIYDVNHDQRQITVCYIRPRRSAYRDL